MKRIVFFVLMFISCHVYAQKSIVIPTDYKLETKEDFVHLEQKVIECVDWLLVHPINKYESKRKEVHAFLISWMAESPYVSIELTEQVVTFVDQPDGLILFMAGWTKYAIESKDYNNLIQANIHGIKAVIKLYKKNKEIMGANPAIEKYLNMEADGTLEAHITALLKS